MEIEILNFEKYNPRKDYTTKEWIRLQTSFYQTDSLWNETAETRLLYVYLLCYARSRNKNPFAFILDKMASLFQIAPETLEKSINRLHIKNLIKINRSNPIGSDRTRSHITEHNITEHNITEQNEQEDIAFDFSENTSKESVATRKKEKASFLFAIANEAHKLRYGVELLRTLQVNRKLKTLYVELGKDMAIKVIKYFYKLPNKNYTDHAHDLQYCIWDLQKLVTEVQSGKFIIDDPKDKIIKSEKDFQSKMEHLDILYQKEGGNDGTNGKSENSFKTGKVDA